MHAIRFSWLAIAVLVVFAIAIRCIHLDADPIAGYVPDDLGYQVDEGYKTLSPRNLILFGNTHWNEHDQYRGWMERSPLTQWAHYASFSEFGVHRVNARAVIVAFFSIFMVASAIFLASRYSRGLALLGVVLLATDPSLFLFSRVAVFEIPLIAVIFVGLLGAAAMPRERTLLALFALLFAAGIASFGIKSSAMLYLLPAIAALLATEAVPLLREPARRMARFAVAGVVLVVAAILAFKSNIWLSRVDWYGPISDLGSLPLHPAYELSPLAMPLAYLAIIDVLLRKGPSGFLDNRFLLMTSSMVLAIPVILSFFEYHPPRYYAAVIPAALLVVLEWLRLRHRGDLEDQYVLSAGRLAAASFVGLLLAGSVLGFVGVYAVAALPFLPQGQDPGLNTRTLKALYPAALFGLIAFSWLLLRKGFLGPMLRVAVLAGVALQIAFSVKIVTQALGTPTYEVRHVQAQIDSILTEGESLAGDWAPFVVVDTRIPAIYIQPGQNDGERIAMLRPTYFLDSGTSRDRVVIAELSRWTSAKDQPIPVGMLYGRELFLIRLHYP